MFFWVGHMSGSLLMKSICELYTLYCNIQGKMQKGKVENQSSIIQLDASLILNNWFKIRTLELTVPDVETIYHLQWGSSKFVEEKAWISNLDRREVLKLGVLLMRRRVMLLRKLTKQITSTKVKGHMIIRNSYLGKGFVLDNSMLLKWIMNVWFVLLSLSECSSPAKSVCCLVQSMIGGGFPDAAQSSTTLDPLMTLRLWWLWLIDIVGLWSTRSLCVIDLGLFLSFVSTSQVYSPSSFSWTPNMRKLGPSI